MIGQHGAARRALEYAFTDMDRDHVISLIAPENVASIKVAERLGETVEGSTHVVGRDVLIYGIDREVWRKTRLLSAETGRSEAL